MPARYNGCRHATGDLAEIKAGFTRDLAELAAYTLTASVLLNPDEEIVTQEWIWRRSSNALTVSRYGSVSGESVVE